MLPAYLTFSSPTQAGRISHIFPQSPEQEQEQGGEEFIYRSTYGNGKYAYRNPVLLLLLLSFSLLILYYGSSIL